MDVEHRNELIDTYFRALDEHDYSILEPAIAEDVTYKSVGIDPLTGPEGFEKYFEELRPFSGTVHEVENRIHAEEASAAEGHVRGEDLESQFCDVFEFDDEHITRITVYTND